MMKQCSKCKKRKDESKFYKQSQAKSGLRSWCKKCEREYARKYNRRDSRPLKKYYSYEKCHRVVDGAKEKRCRKCGKWKAESNFYKKRRHKDGLAAYCKECANKATNRSRRRRMALSS